MTAYHKTNYFLSQKKNKTNYLKKKFTTQCKKQV